MKFYDYNKKIWISNEKKFIIADRGEDLVDTSNFIPELTQIQSLSGQTKTKKYYDFEDGKDDGLNLHNLRNPGLDIAEKDTLIKSYQAKAEQLGKEIKKEALEKMHEAINGSDENNNANANQENSTNNTGN